jgi:surfactin synthase thioesterase subunit
MIPTITTQRSTTGGARWVRTFRAARPPAGLHVVCFPPAGGTAGSFEVLRRVVDPTTAVSIAILPGREARMDEPAATDLGEVADALAARLLAVGIGEESPYVLLGHSLGGLLAYETALRLHQAGAPRPLELTVVASAAPDHSGWCQAAVAEPVDLMRRLGGMPRELYETPQLLELAVRALADDLAMIGGYRCGGGRVPAPIRVVGGTLDAEVGPDSVAGWDGFSAVGTDIEWVESGHYPLNIEALCGSLLTGWQAKAALSTLP